MHKLDNWEGEIAGKRLQYKVNCEFVEICYNDCNSFLELSSKTEDVLERPELLIDWGGSVLARILKCQGVCLDDLEVLLTLIDDLLEYLSVKRELAFVSLRLRSGFCLISPIQSSLLRQIVVA